MSGGVNPQSPLAYRACHWQLGGLLGLTFPLKAHILKLISSQNARKHTSGYFQFQKFFGGG
jgi:hypothetical protein